MISIFNIFDVLNEINIRLRKDKLHLMEEGTFEIVSLDFKNEILDQCIKEARKTITGQACLSKKKIVDSKDTIMIEINSGFSHLLSTFVKTQIYKDSEINFSGINIFPDGKNLRLYLRFIAFYEDKNYVLNFVYVLNPASVSNVLNYLIFKSIPSLNRILPS